MDTSLSGWCDTTRVRLTCIPNGQARTISWTLAQKSNGRTHIGTPYVAERNAAVLNLYRTGVAIS